MLNFKVTVQPSVEVISLALAKTQLRVDFPDDDILITGLITAARQWAEAYTRRAFFTQTIVLSLDQFPLFGFQGGTIPPAGQNSYNYFSAYWGPMTIRLPRPGAVGVTSITYLDLTGTTQTLDPIALLL